MIDRIWSFDMGGVMRMRVQPVEQPIDVVIETEEPALPHRGHIVGQVGPRESCVEDGDPRLGDRNVMPFDPGAAAGVSVLRGLYRASSTVSRRGAVVALALERLSGRADYHCGRPACRSAASSTWPWQAGDGEELAPITELRSASIKAWQIVLAACRIRSSTSEALSASRTSSSADWVQGQALSFRESHWSGLADHHTVAPPACSARSQGRLCTLPDGRHLARRGGRDSGPLCRQVSIR